MFQKLQQQFIKFSRENWWVFVMFLVSLICIFFTDSGNIVEITGVFLVYFSAELCMMIMVAYMHDKDYKTSSIFQLLGNTIFTLLFLYHYIVNGQVHYFLASPIFISGAIKNILLYHLDIPISWINAQSVFLLGVTTFGTYYYINPGDISMQIVLQSGGMILFSSYLVMTDAYERFKYFWGLTGLSFMVIGSLYGVGSEYLVREIQGITLAFVLMPLTVLIVYIKSIRKYI